MQFNFKHYNTTYTSDIITYTFYLQLTWRYIHIFNRVGGVDLVVRQLVMMNHIHVARPVSCKK